MSDKLIVLNDEELRRRSQALHETQELYEELAFLKNPKMPCPECGGSGSVYGGSLGDVCPRCGGGRLLDQPSSEDFEMPDFRSMRAAITAYYDAMADGVLPTGHAGKRNLRLPPVESVPTLEEIEELREAGKEKAKALKSADFSQLPPAPARRQEGLGGVTDAELDELEDAATEED
jgi:hypothetical protein